MHLKVGYGRSRKASWRKQQWSQALDSAWAMRMDVPGADINITKGTSMFANNGKRLTEERRWWVLSV
jgi:hypothetical protein